MLEDNVEAVMSLFEAVDVTTAKVIAQAIVTLFVQNGNIFALLKGVIHRELGQTRRIPSHYLISSFNFTINLKIKSK